MLQVDNISATNRLGRRSAKSYYAGMATDPVKDNSFSCPVCGIPAELSQARARRHVDCERCGEYGVAADAEAILRAKLSAAPNRRALSCFLRHAGHGTHSADLDTHTAFGLIERLETPLPRAAPDEVTRFLSRKGGPLSATIEGWSAVLYQIDTKSTLSDLLKEASTERITLQEGRDRKYKVELTEKGGAYLEALRERNRRRAPKGKKGHLQSGTMYVERLAISNFKCFKDEQILDFRRQDGKFAPWTLLLGDNGVGKSTILQIIAAQAFLPDPSRPFDHQGLRRREVASSFDGFAMYDVGPRDDRRTSWIEVLLTQRKGKRVRHRFASGVWHRGDQNLDTYFVNMDVRFPYAGVRFAGGPYEYFYGGSARFDTFTPVIAYGASRHSGEPRISHERRPADQIKSLFDEDFPLRNPEEWLLQADYSLRLSGEGNGSKLTAVTRVKSLLLKLLPGVHEIVVQAPDRRHASPYVAFETDFGLVDFEGLSLGYRSTIAFIVDLAVQMVELYPDEDDPFSQPVLVLIDEIDLHLHPRWQRSIMKDLEESFNGAQFIATSHSPVMIQGSPNMNLIVLHRIEDQVLAINDLDFVNRWRADQILTSKAFGLRSARPDFVSNLEQQRIRLKSKGRRTAYEQAELDSLERRLAILPRTEIVDEAQESDEEILREFFGEPRSSGTPE